MVEYVLVTLLFTAQVNCGWHGSCSSYVPVTAERYETKQECAKHIKDTRLNYCLALVKGE